MGKEDTKNDFAIALVEKGKAPSLQHTSKANEVIKGVNAARNGRVIPSSAGRVIQDESGWALDLNGALSGNGQTFQAVVLVDGGLFNATIFGVIGTAV